MSLLSDCKGSLLLSAHQGLLCSMSWLAGFGPGGCFFNVSRALQNNLAKTYNARNHIYGENFKLKLCTCALSMALGTRIKFQLEIIISCTLSAIQKFGENILESSRNVSETIPWSLTCCYVTVQILWATPYTGYHLDISLNMLNNWKIYLRRWLLHPRLQTSLSMSKITDSACPCR